MKKTVHTSELQHKSTFTQCTTAATILAFSVCSQFVYAGDPTIFAAIETNQLPAVTAIVQANPSSVNSKDEFGFTPLHLATENTAVAKLLIANGANINAKSEKFGTVVQHAVSDGNVELVELLIAKGVDLKATGEDGLTVMHRLAWIKNPTTASAMFQLLYAQVPSLLDAPGEINATPLWMCVDRINAPVAALLVSKGANPSKDPDGRGSSAVAFLKQRLVEDPSLTAELQALAGAMKVK